MRVMNDAVIGPGAAPARPPALEPKYEGDFVLEQPLQLESGRVLAQPTLQRAGAWRVPPVLVWIMPMIRSEARASSIMLR